MRRGVAVLIILGGLAIAGRADAQSCPLPETILIDISCEECVPGTEFRFRAITFPDPPQTCLRFEWDFDDGGHAVGPLVTHVFSGAGQYDITLTVRSPDGSSKKVSRFLTLFAGTG